MSRPNGRTRVMVVDDAVVARLLVTEALMHDPDLELAGTAADGQMALDTLDDIAPDVVVLDVEMPVLDGLETLKAIRARHRTLPVVMFSTLTERGARTTFDALALGATDYVTKPHVGSREESVRVLRDELLPLLKALARPRAVAAPPPQLPRRVPGIPTAEVVVVGSSTGGANALAAVLPSLPADLRVPVVVANHMPAALTRLLAERLGVVCALPVAEARGGEVLEPGTVWVAQGGHDVVVAREGGAVRLVRRDASSSSATTPSIDALFRSAAQTYGRGALGVLLTGMGQDALAGCRALRDAGGQVVVQDHATSVVWDMARSVVEAGLTDAVVPLPHLAEELLGRVGVRAWSVTPR